MGDHAEATLRLSFRALRIVERNMATEHLICPVCYAEAGLGTPTVHSRTCELAAAITAIRELLPDVAGEEGA